MSYNVFIVNPTIMDNWYAEWFTHDIVTDIEFSDVVLFPDGDQLSPFLYKDIRKPHSIINPTKDLSDIKWFKKAVKKEIPIIGIGRGAELICVMNGGKVIQDHPFGDTVQIVENYDGTKNLAECYNSMTQFPFNIKKENYFILSWRKPLKYHYNGKGKEMNPEVLPDIVYYPKTKSLAIESYPQSLSKTSTSLKWLNQHLDYLISNTLWQKLKKYQH